MSENRNASRSPAPSHAVDAEDPQGGLRAMGARAHQLRAALRAADHYNSQSHVDERDTGSWLISSALDLAQDVVADIDSLARQLKERPADAALQQTVAALRVRSHQLYASTRAADHFLDQDSNEDRETGGWLVASAHALAVKLASGFDDSAAPARRGGAEKGSELQEAGGARRPAPLRGAA
jgi:hypothetical protein